MLQYMKKLFKKKSALFMVILAVLVLGLLVTYFGRPGDLRTDLQGGINSRELSGTPDARDNSADTGSSLDSRILAELQNGSAGHSFGSSRTILGGGSQQSGGTPCVANQLPSASASPSTVNLTDFKKAATFTLTLVMPSQKSNCDSSPAFVILDPSNKDITNTLGVTADNYSNFLTIDKNNIQQSQDGNTVSAPISLDLSTLAGSLKTNGNYTLKLVSGSTTIGSMILNVTANVVCTYPSLAFSPATAVAVSDFTKAATLTLNNTLPNSACVTGVLLDPSSKDITSNFSGGLAVTSDSSTAVQTVKSNAKQLTVNFANYQNNTFTSNGTYTFKLMKSDGKTLLASIPLNITALPCSNLSEKLSASTLAVTDFTKSTSALTLTPAISSKCNLGGTIVDSKKNDLSNNFDMGKVVSMNGTSITFDATKLSDLSAKYGGGNFTLSLVNKSDSNKVLTTLTLSTPACTGLSYTVTPTSLTYTDLTKPQTITLSKDAPGAVCGVVPKIYDNQGNDVSSQATSMSGLSNFLNAIGTTGSVAQFVKNQSKQISLDFSSYGKSKDAKNAQFVVKLVNPADNNAVVATVPVVVAGIKVPACTGVTGSFTDLSVKGAKPASTLTLLSTKADKNGLSPLFNMSLPFGQCNVAQQILDPSGADISSYVLSQQNTSKIMVAGKDSFQLDFNMFRSVLPKVGGKYKVGNYVAKFFNLDDGNKLIATLTVTISN